MMNLGGIAGLRQPQESKIPEGMASLIQSLKDLKRTANPVTPAGTPTVAGQVEQAIAQRLTPQADISQLGTPQMQPVGPGVQQSAQMANIAAQQQQAQQQQAMQAAMQMAQQQPQQPQAPQQPQPMAEGGIALLPADNIARIEQYARGGILGFNGQDRSDVPTTEEDVMKAYRAWQDSKGPWYLPTPQASSESKALENLYIKKLNEFQGAKPQVQSQVDTAAEVANLQERYPAQVPTSKYVSQPSQPSQMAQVASRPGQPGGTQGIQDLLKGLDKPTMEKIVQSSKELFPDNPKIKEMESLTQQIFDLQKQRPDLESEGIAALRQHEAQRKGLLSQQREGDFWGKLSAYGKDLYERGSNDRLNKVISGIDARDRADIDASLIAKQMELKLMDLAHQRKVGNLEQQQKLKKEIIDLDQKRQDNIIQASNISEHLAATVYGQEAGARMTAATMAQKEREMALNRKAMDMQKDQTLLARLNEDIGLKGDKILKDFREQNKLRYDQAEIEPNEQKKKAAKELLDQEAEARKEQAVADLKRQRDLVMQKITGVDMNDMSKWGKNITTTPIK